jgi:hypothetical protein
MNVFPKGGEEFCDNSFELFRRLCSERFGAEVQNTNFCVAGHFCRMPYKSFGREYSKSSTTLLSVTPTLAAGATSYWPLSGQEISPNCAKVNSAQS